MQFGADVLFSYYLYVNEDFNWRTLDTIHLMINHRHYRTYAQWSIYFSQLTRRLWLYLIIGIVDLYYNKTPILDEKTIKDYPYPFGAMAREMIEASGMENLKLWWPQKLFCYLYNLLYFSLYFLYWIPTDWSVGNPFVLKFTFKIKIWWNIVWNVTSFWTCGDRGPSIRKMRVWKLRLIKEFLEGKSCSLQVWSFSKV